VFRRQEHGVEMVQLRWGFPPARSKGAPVINFRSEGRRFPKGRCLIPASHFFEFTGTKPSKSKWQFRKAGEEWFCFAGLWRPMPDGAGDAFTILTTEPDLTSSRSTIVRWWSSNAPIGSLGST
jgi:putative SOS response-associated peptidase YedK